MVSLQAAFVAMLLSNPGQTVLLDFYSDKLIDKEFHLLDFWPEPGVYTLRLECVGKNSKSEGNNLGLESVRLRPGKWTRTFLQAVGQSLYRFRLIALW